MRNNQSNRFGRHPLLIKLSGIPMALLLCGTVYAAPPINDDCAGAIELASSAPFPPDSANVDATDATLDETDPGLSCNTPSGNDGTQTVWFKHTPAASGLVDYSTFGSTDTGGGVLDTAHGVFTGSCGALVEVGCADVDLTDSLNLEVDAGMTYYIKVGQFAGGSDAGTVFLNVDEGVETRVPEKLVIESSFNGESAPISEIIGGLASQTNGAARTGNKFDGIYEVPNRMKPEGLNSKSAAEVVGSAIPGSGKVKWRGPADLLQVFDGGNNDDNFPVYGGIVSPPDTIGDVGKDHYVQMFNLLTEIFDKEGNSVYGPFPTSAFFNGIEDSFCSISNDGDPIVAYDEETDRWLVSQFLAGFQDGLCIAISTSGDPTGSWNAYEFDFTGIGFPDYPKFGFATGAVNVMINLFDPLQGSALGAIDKAEMLAGDPATMVLFTGGENLELLFGWVPGDNDGPVFDNTLPTFFTGPPFFSDIVLVAELTPDWQTPEDTGLSFQVVPVTAYDSILCGAPRGACIDQPGSGTDEGGNPDWGAANTIAFLEGISDRMMHRAQTRDSGNTKTAILNHTVDVDGSGKAGVRWYELRNHKDRGWTLKKEETFSPDGDHRWMGSVAMTASGSTCLGYSISSATTYPSIGITGRKGKSNHMNIKELVAYDGNPAGNVQRASPRWGDYSSMSIDPVDDTCWYTQEHATSLQSRSRFSGLIYGEVAGWATKIIQYDVN